MNPLLLFTLARYGAAIAAGFFLASQLYGHQITKLTLEYTNERLAQQRAAHVLKERNLETVLQAQNRATARVAVLKRESDAARSAADGLRESIDASTRAARSDADTCNRIVTAYGVVLASGSEFIQNMARDADQCFSDQKLIQEAWPR